MVNEVLLNLSGGHGWDLVDFALQMGHGIEEIQLRHHFENDSSNAYMIALMAETLKLPTMPAGDFSNGEITRRLKREKDVRSWTYQVLARKVLPKGYSQENIGWMVTKLENFFCNGSTDAWMVARLCEVFDLPTLASSWFLNAEEVQDLKAKRQLELSL